MENIMDFIELLACPECFLVNDLCRAEECGTPCKQFCDYKAIDIVDGKARIDMTRCTSCSQCSIHCPHNAISKANLIFEKKGGRHFLVCEKCNYWYPIKQDIPILLPKKELSQKKDYIGNDYTAKKYISVRADDWIELRFLSYTYYSRYRDFLKWADKLSRDGYTVDMGCSTGNFALNFENYIGIDNSWKFLLFAKRLYSNKTFILADAAYTPLKTDSIHNFISRSLLEHALNDGQIIREVYRITKMGGLFEIPSRDGISVFFDPINYFRIKYNLSPIRFGAFGYGHINLKSIVEWKAQIEKQGFIINADGAVGRGLGIALFNFLEAIFFSCRDSTDLPMGVLPRRFFHILEKIFKLLNKIDLKSNTSFCRVYHVQKHKELQ